MILDECDQYQGNRIDLVPISDEKYNKKYKLVLATTVLKSAASVIGMSATVHEESIYAMKAGDPERRYHVINVPQFEEQ